MRGIRRISIPAISATSGWITKTSNVIGGFFVWRRIVGEDFTGGCLCGEVRYRITAAPVEALYCHCRMCQRAHGAPVVAWLTGPLHAFEIAAGNPVAYRSSTK